MNHFVKYAVAAVFMTFALFTAAQSHAKLSSPPPQLTGIFMDFAEFEAAFKSGNWKEAQEATGKIRGKFNQMLPQLKKDIKGNPEKTFLGIMAGLNQSVKNQDKGTTQKLFIDMHKYVLTLISNYDYKTPPIFIIINKYIKEAEEALEQKKYDRVLSEVEEITFLFSFAESHLESRDTRRKQIDDIKAQLLEIKSAAQFKKGEPVKNGFKTLKKMLSELIRIG